MGHTVVAMDRWDPEEALRLIDRYKCTHTHMVPTQFIRMLQLPDEVKAKYDVSSMRWAIHAAAPCPVDVKRKMLDWWGPVIWEYRSEEHTSELSHTDISRMPSSA